MCEGEGWGLSPPPPAHPPLSPPPLPLSTAVRTQCPAQGFGRPAPTWNAGLDRQQQQRQQQRAAHVWQQLLSVWLPAPLSLARGRRQFCAPGAPPIDFAKERVSPRVFPPPPPFTPPPQKLPLPGRGQPGGGGIGSALSHVAVVTLSAGCRSANSVAFHSSLPRAGVPARGRAG